MKISEQLRRNSLAMISLIVALTALGYNSWRNELTEQNRNVRTAGFEMIVHIGKLQRIVYLAQYEAELGQESPRAGEVEVLIIRDLSRLMPEFTQAEADILLDTWQINWRDLGNDDEQAAAAIDTAMNNLRIGILRALSALE